MIGFQAGSVTNRSKPGLYYDDVARAHECVNSLSAIRYICSKELARVTRRPFQLRFVGLQVCS